MEKYNFSQYFDIEDIKYYEPKIIITILEDILGKNLDTIKSELDDLKIYIVRQQIEEYLEKKFEEENSELKRRIENAKLRKRIGNSAKWTEQDIADSTQEFGDRLNAARYYFEPYTLQYFNKYSNIVRNKAKQILNIMEKIVNKDYHDIADLLVELDIQLDESGNIAKEDIIRLITPFFHNYNSLVEKINTANNLETYLTFKQSLDSVYRSGCSEGELYPTSSIQVKNLYYDCLPGNVPLSTNQKQVLRKEQRKSMKKFAKMLLK